MELFKYIITFVSGSVVLELIKLFYPDLKNLISRRVNAKLVFYSYSELILKSADELFGKIYSLAEEDFNTFTKYTKTNEMNKIYILYLFARFWASLAILKQESSFVNLGRIRKGKKLLRFVTAYESKKNRILERSYQRAIGESIILGDRKIMSLFEFKIEYCNQDSQINRIIKPLEIALFRTWDKDVRQRFLLFGIILHSLIDFLDKDHVLVRNRKPYTNKLNEKTKDQLRVRIFNQYLPFVKNKENYYKK